MSATILKALDDYAEAVRMVEFWGDHGTWGDSKLEQAREDAAKARARVLSLVSRYQGTATP